MFITFAIGVLALGLAVFVAVVVVAFMNALGETWHSGRYQFRLDTFLVRLAVLISFISFCYFLGMLIQSLIQGGL